MKQVRKQDGKRTNPVWRRTTVAAMAAVMLVGGATGAFADGNGNGKGQGKGHSPQVKINGKIELNLNFSDLNEKDWKWAYEHIIRLASKQVFNGYADGSFKPGNTITRIEAIVAAVRLLGLKDEAESADSQKAQLNFKDFKQVQKKYPWAVGYVKVALEHDLFSEDETNVQPDKPADRLWATVLLVKALKLDGEAKEKMDEQLPFRDAKQIPAGSVGYVAEAVEKGLITGYSDRTFQPNKPVTRAELAALLDRVDGQLPNSDSQAITGSVVSVSGRSLSVKKADGTTVALTLDPNVFVFRNDLKVAASALVSGDQVLVRTYQGQVVFVEVTQPAAAPQTTTDTGTVSYFTLNGDGKLATLTLTKTGSNGTSASVLYNVSSDVKITGGSGVLSPNQTVVVTISQNVITAIAIQS